MAWCIRTSRQQALETRMFLGQSPPECRLAHREHLARFRRRPGTGGIVLEDIAQTVGNSRRHRATEPMAAIRQRDQDTDEAMGLRQIACLCIGKPPQAVGQRIREFGVQRNLPRRPHSGFDWFDRPVKAMELNENMLGKCQKDRPERTLRLLRHF